ncbi:MAG: ImmA/IrrE family metallo-endopeptidase [Alphaproteobacteria bacterium]|nr:MAG: ImmA/IrrE family metallo-endopeptidase [Alphaproteobacteria bacterium]
MTMQNPSPVSLIGRYTQIVPVDVYGLLAEIGLGPDFIDMDDDISGWIEKRSDGSYRVAINARHHRVRQRFTAAHELGHYIYHRDLLGSGVGDTRAYRAEGSGRPNPAILPMHERQANSFAANLLMPKEQVYRQIQLGHQSTEGLAQLFDVSQPAMRIRLGRAG